MALPDLTADGRSQMNQKGTWEGIKEESWGGFPLLTIK